MMNADSLEQGTVEAEVPPPTEPVQQPAQSLPSDAPHDVSSDEARLHALEAVFAERLAEESRKAQEWERACKAAIRDRELVTALVGKALVPGAADQLMKLWRDDFEVVDEVGTTRVVARDGRGLGTVVSERLASSEYAHYCQPTSRGGTAPGGTNRPASPGPAPTAPQTLGEVAIRRWLEAAAKPGDISSPIGLNRRRR